MTCRDVRRQQQVSRAATNELGPARDNCGHGHLSLINNIKAIYLTGSFLIVRMKVRYSPNHYLLLLVVYYAKQKHLGCKKVRGQEEAALCSD